MSDQINWKELTPDQKDSIVAEKLFNWQPVECSEELTIYDDGEAFCYGCKQRDHISTFEHGIIAHLPFTRSMGCAWQVAIGYDVIDLLKYEPHRYRVRLCKGNKCAQATAETAPEAICIAALILAGFTM